MNNSTSYFSIKGLVGAGKSSLIKCLPALLELEGCKIVSEPIHLYTSFMEGLYNPLGELQMDPIQSVVVGQLHIIQLSRRYYNDQVFKASLACQHIVVSEQSICLSYSFVETHFRMKSMSAFSKDFLNKCSTWILYSFNSGGSLLSIFLGQEDLSQLITVVNGTNDGSTVRPFVLGFRW